MSGDTELIRAAMDVGTEFQKLLHSEDVHKLRQQIAVQELHAREDAVDANARLSAATSRE